MAYKGKMLDNDIVYDMATVSELYRAFANIEQQYNNQGVWTQELVYEAYSVLARNWIL